jgi:hypothetical protein
MLLDNLPEIQTCAENCSFLTIPNAFIQCTIPLLIIHSAIAGILKEKLPDPSKINARFII